MSIPRRCHRNDIFSPHQVEEDAGLFQSHLKELLDRYEEFGAPPVSSLTPQMARQLPELRDACQHVLSHRALRRLSPDSMTEKVEKVEHHVIGSLNTRDGSARALCNSGDCVVVSVGYRQAPEQPCPAARNDAFRGYIWALDLARSLGGDPDRVAVAGEGAGGNLATVVCLMARDQGLRLPIHQLLICPMTQFGFETESYLEHAHAKPLDRATMMFFWRHYLFGGADAKDPYHSPILTGEIDPLRSDGELYARALAEDGVPVYQQTYPGVAHEFFGFSNCISTARDAREAAAEQLRAAFDTALFEHEERYETIYSRRPGMRPDKSPGY